MQGLCTAPTARTGRENQKSSLWLPRCPPWLGAPSVEGMNDTSLGEWPGQGAQSGSSESANVTVPQVTAFGQQATQPHGQAAQQQAQSHFAVGQDAAQIQPGQPRPSGQPDHQHTAPTPGYDSQSRDAHSGAGQQRPPLRIALTALHLAAYGFVGIIIVVLLFAGLAIGLGTLPLLGVGVIALVGLVYVLYGLAWFESQRVSGLYSLNVATLRMRPQRGPGFQAWLLMLWSQLQDGRMWRALGSFGVASIMGTAALGLLQWFVHAVIDLMRAAPSLRLGSMLAIVLSVAGIAGLILLHRLVTVAIIGSDAVEQELTEQVRATREQREGAVRAADVERTRIERDLHDGVQPRLVSVGMTLGLAQEKIDSDPVAAKELIAEAHTSTKAAITELRQLARGIYASVLDDRGLDAALSALAARSHIPVQLDVRLQDRCSRNAEAAVYFAIAESLTNAAKHSRASEARVVVRLREDDLLWARVEDNGIGGARVTPGGGLDGVMNRVLAAGGTSRLDSPLGGPTSLEVSVPCAS